MWRRKASITLIAVAVSAAGTLVPMSPVQASGDGHHEMAMADHHDGMDKGRRAKVEIQDDCDPASFNAVLPPGSCVGDGETTFGAFIAEVTATKKAAAWKFDPSMLTIRNGRPVILENEGGETHSFTMVKSFGGGVVPILNQLSVPGLPLASECASLDADGKTIIPAPPSAANVYVAADKEAAFQTAGLAPGITYMFQCCIHPWMRIFLTVT